MTPDTGTVTKLIRTVVAEEVVPRFEKLAHGDVREKAPGDYVTIADIETERRLTEELTRLLPGSVVIGEEAAAADPAILGLLAEDAPVWVIDPVDGTWNFSEGRRHFATMVALVRAEQIEAAWIHDPLGGDTAVAEAGAGAWIGDRRLTVAEPTAAGRAARRAPGRLFRRQEARGAHPRAPGPSRRGQEPALGGA